MGKAEVVESKLPERRKYSLPLTTLVSSAVFQLDCRFCIMPQARWETENGMCLLQRLKNLPELCVTRGLLDTLHNLNRTWVTHLFWTLGRYSEIWNDGNQDGLSQAWASLLLWSECCWLVVQISVEVYAWYAWDSWDFYQRSPKMSCSLIISCEFWAVQNKQNALRWGKKL